MVANRWILGPHAVSHKTIDRVFIPDKADLKLEGQTFLYLFYRLPCPITHTLERIRRFLGAGAVGPRLQIWRGTVKHTRKKYHAPSSTGRLLDHLLYSFFLPI